MAAKKTPDKGTPSSVFKVGAIALAFLVIGYQSALFLHRAAVLRIEALRDRPDTVYVVDAGLAARVLGTPQDSGAWNAASGSTPAAEPTRPATGSGTAPTKHSAMRGSAAVIVRRDASHSESVNRVRRQGRPVESFRFNPNTVSVDELIRLGFSEKQALAIDSYRAKGGRFRRRSDFARSYVVSDSVFRRLEPFIDIPRLDINRADSADFDGLPGIGPYFAAKMVSYRERLGGYSYTAQLMDIYNFDREKYDGLADLIICSKPGRPFRLWTLSADSLRLHPYIRDWQTARSIVLFRDNTPKEGWTVQALADASILSRENADRLSRCLIAPAD